MWNLSNEMIKEQSQQQQTITCLHDIPKYFKSIPFCITEFEFLEFRKVLVIVFEKSIDGLYWHADQFEVNKGISTRVDIQCIGQ